MPQNDSTNIDVDEFPAWAQKVYLFYETLYQRKIKQEFDAVVLFIADEGMGKSTFMCQSTWFWKLIKGQEPTVDNVLSRFCWDDREEFKHLATNSPRRSVINVGDAARVLHKKETMATEQVEIEKDLLDIRTLEYLLQFGYQDWETVPDLLQRRRAKYAWRIPERGTLHGYSRNSLDEKYRSMDAEEWPKPDLVTQFPSLEGTPLWEKYKEIDRHRKQARISNGDDDGEEDDAERERDFLKSVAQDIKTEGIQPYVNIHGGNKTRYIDEDLIQLRAPEPLNAQQARKVKKLLDTDPDIVIPDDPDQDPYVKTEVSA